MKKLLLVITIVITSVCVNAQVLIADYGQKGILVSNKWTYGQLYDLNVRIVFDGVNFYVTDRAYSRYRIYGKGKIEYGSDYSTLHYDVVKDEKGRKCNIAIITMDDDDKSRVFCVIYKNVLYRYFIDNDKSDIQ
jgi:hypothetical protein